MSDIFCLIDNHSAFNVTLKNVDASGRIQDGHGSWTDMNFKLNSEVQNATLCPQV